MGENYRNSSIDVGTDLVEVSRAVPVGKRIEIILTNVSTGTQKITLSIGGHAASNAGIVLSPGGSWFASEQAGYRVTQEQITAISSAASGILAVFERNEVL